MVILELWGGEGSGRPSLCEQPATSFREAFGYCQNLCLYSMESMNAFTISAAM